MTVYKQAALHIYADKALHRKSQGFAPSSSFFFFLVKVVTYFQFSNTRSFSSHILEGNCSFCIGCIGCIGCAPLGLFVCVCVGGGGIWYVEPELQCPKTP